MYYRYYHDPGDHNTRAHYGVRTKTHKLIYFWKKDQWELYDLVKDPNELKNVYNDPAYNPNLSLLRTDFGMAFPPRKPRAVAAAAAER